MEEESASDSTMISTSPPITTNLITPYKVHLQDQSRIGRAIQGTRLTRCLNSGAGSYQVGARALKYPPCTHPFPRDLFVLPSDFMLEVS